MILLLNHIFITFIYQPFFNLLVYIYLILDKATLGKADMGTALIIFTFVFRIILLPLSLSSDRSEKEKREIREKVRELEVVFKHDPLRLKAEKKKVLTKNKKFLLAEITDVGLQVLVILMLFRIFRTGLEGADLHLLYSFMPKINEPFNLIFLGRYDLSQPNFYLNIVSSLVIFVAEFLSIRLSPLPASAEDKLMLILMPVGAFTYFAFMPAGKKLFVISTLLFSIGFILVKQVVFLYYKLKGNLPGRKKPAWQR